MYPKRLPETFSPTQRELLLALLPPASSIGLFQQAEHTKRFFGALPAGPSDHRIEVGDGPVPAWWAVSAAAAGHLPVEPVREALLRLDGEVASAIVEEIVRGEAYDVREAHATSMKDWGFSAKPYQVRYRQTLAELLADVAVALGARGRETAVKLVTQLPSFGGGAQALLGLYLCARTGGIDESLDVAWSGLGRKLAIDAWVCEPLLRRVAATLPPARRAAFEAALAT